MLNLCQGSEMQLRVGAPGSSGMETGSCMVSNGRRSDPRLFTNPIES